MIETRKLGHNGPELTTVGFGAWAVGGPWKVGWGPQSDADSIAAIRRALELGCNWIDTAAIYGLGHSEEVVGRAIQGLPRDQVFIATKCGRVPDATGTPHGNLHPDSIRREMQASLRRLGTDYVDLYQIHWPADETGTPLEESWATLAALQDEGKARYIGVSNFNVEQMARCEPIRHINSLQPPYSLLRREVEAEILPWCLQNGTGVIVYSPMQAGLLSGSFDINRVAPDDWRRNNPLFQEPQLSKNLAFVERLRPIAARHGKTVGQLAIAWTLMHPAVTAAIVGARRPAQVEENVSAMGWRLAEAEMAEIEAALR
ncbi:MAG TPA: aldo/keto reductase [Chthonomonadaceae bacterium]|nr:aldo/keto reductase [Chthonomonadaceae bacterium]